MKKHAGGKYRMPAEDARRRRMAALEAQMRAHNLTHGSGCWMRALPVEERQRRASVAANARWALDQRKGAAV